MEDVKLGQGQQYPVCETWNRSGLTLPFECVECTKPLKGKTNPVAEVPCSAGLSDFVSLADELEKEGAFLNTPTGYSADRAAGQAYEDCAKRIRETIEKTKGR